MRTKQWKKKRRERERETKSRMPGAEHLRDSTLLSDMLKAQKEKQKPSGRSSSFSQRKFSDIQTLQGFFC